MAITATTLASAVAATDVNIRPTALTGFAVNQMILVDQEVMVQVGAAVGTQIPVRRGLDGTVQAAHAAASVVVTGLPSEFPGPAPGQTSVFGPASIDGQQGGWNVYTYSAAGAIPPVSGLHIINGAGVTAMTLAAPSAAQEGAALTVISKNLNANTLVVTGLLGGAGPTGTFAATGGSVEFKAVGGKWAVLAGVGVTFA